MPAQSVRVCAVSLRCFIRLQAGADIHEDVIPVLRIHLRRQPVFLIGAGLQKLPDLPAERVHCRAAVQAAEAADQINIGLDDAFHRTGLNRGSGPIYDSIADKRLVKIVPVPGHRIPLFFTAEQIAAPLGVSFDIIHQQVPAPKMQVEIIVPPVVGAACFGHDVFHEVKACLGEPSGRMIAGRQLFFRSRPAHENTVSFICIEPRFDGGKGEHISVVHTCTCLVSIPMINEPQLQLADVVPGDSAGHILHADRKHRLPVDPKTSVVVTERHDRNAAVSINNSTFHIRFYIRRHYRSCAGSHPAVNDDISFCLIQDSPHHIDPDTGLQSHGVFYFCVHWPSSALYFLTFIRHS